MGHKHTAADLLAAAVAVAHRDGLSRLSFGRVAAELGINDRTVVYYFPTKTALVTEVVTTVGGQLALRLAGVVPGSASDHRQLLRLAWPVLAQPDTDPVLRLFFEANGLAAAGLAPYDTLVPALVAGWVAWAQDRIDEDDAVVRRAEAEAAIALVDGLLLFRQVAGAHAADRAAERLLADG